MKELISSGDNPADPKEIAEVLAEGVEPDEASSEPSYPYPYPITTGGPQQLPGRTRACCFWISSYVPEGRRYLMDTKTLPNMDMGNHNLARDVVPEDALLVLVHPRDASHIWKALNTRKPTPHPAFIAAEIIDSICVLHPSMPERVGWTVFPKRQPGSR